MSDSLLDELLDDSQTNYLKETCPSLFDGSGAPKFSYNNILSKDEDFIIPDGLKYYQVVESGNNYVNDLLNEEETYLKQKYGESLYNYFVTKRDDYINNRMKSVCSTIVSGSGSGSGSSSDSSGSLIVALTQQLNSYRQSILTYNEVSKRTEKKVESKFLNARKFEYRSGSMNDLNKIDTAISAFYYIILVSCIAYLVFMGHLELNKNFWVYMLLLLLPIMLSRIYGFVVMCFHKLRATISEQGPNNAFLNEM
tara:strand:+ start:37 stop:795 length:759 start_codon:yes stop_codon:yes gene_type:complete